MGLTFVSIAIVSLLLSAGVGQGVARSGTSDSVNWSDFSWLQEVPPGVTIELEIRAWDVDETPVGNEVDVNGMIQGYLVGSDGVWSTSTILVPPEYPYVRRVNLVQIFVPYLSDGIQVDYIKAIVKQYGVVKATVTVTTDNLGNYPPATPPDGDLDVIITQLDPRWPIEIRMP